MKNLLMTTALVAVTSTAAFANQSITIQTGTLDGGIPVTTIYNVVDQTGFATEEDINDVHNLATSASNEAEDAWYKADAVEDRVDVLEDTVYVGNNSVYITNPNDEASISLGTDAQITSDSRVILNGEEGVFIGNPHEELKEVATKDDVEALDEKRKQNLRWIDDNLEAIEANKSAIDALENPTSLNADYSIGGYSSAASVSVQSDNVKTSVGQSTPNGSETWTSTEHRPGYIRTQAGNYNAATGENTVVNLDVSASGVTINGEEVVTTGDLSGLASTSSVVAITEGVANDAFSSDLKIVTGEDVLISNLTQEDYLELQSDIDKVTEAGGLVGTIDNVANNSAAINSVNTKVNQAWDAIYAIETTPGEKGDKGDAGRDGLNGINGIDGVKGEKGDQGEQGIQGDKGDRGEKGERGEAGITTHVIDSSLTEEVVTAAADKAVTEAVSIVNETTNALNTQIGAVNEKIEQINTIVRTDEDGRVHLGENSFITSEEENANGETVQVITAEDENGETIAIEYKDSEIATKSDVAEVQSQINDVDEALSAELNERLKNLPTVSNQAQVDDNSAAIKGLEEGLSSLSATLSAGIAGNAAQVSGLSALGGEAGLYAGLGNFNGVTALALGGQFSLSDGITANFGASFDSTGKNPVVSGGVGFKF